MSYAPLWVKSNFSFLEGASQPDELVEAAQRLGLSALALCDRDGVPKARGRCGAGRFEPRRSGFAAGRLA